MIPSPRAARVVLGLILMVTGSAPATFAAEVGAVEQIYDVHDLIWTGGPGSAQDFESKSRHELVQDVIKLIRETVEPDAWDEGRATVRERDGRLVVNAQPAVHTSLVNIFEQLREGVSCVQGITLDCQFIVADAGFVGREFPELLKPTAADVKPGVRAVGALKARQLAEAARGPAAAQSGAVISVPAALPLYFMQSSFSHSTENAFKLPLLVGTSNKADASRGAVEVRRPVGMSLSVHAAYDTRYVTLDLSTRHCELDAKPGGAVEELEAAYRGTFTVERSGAFVVCAPLVRARLVGVRESDGPAGVRREVVREAVAAAEQPNPARFLLLVVTARAMSPAEVTLLAGAHVAQIVSEREAGHADLLQPAALPAARPAGPGVPPAPPPQPPDNSESSRVYNIAGLLLGSEPDAERPAARAKRLQRVLDAITKQTGDRAHLRELGGQLIVTARPPDHLKVYSLLTTMMQAQVLRPE
jgi:hypothetical protein